ncbi:multiple cyclophane-containing RiPP AmcA [Micromonospora haikouensis]|uniref:multiple cyclophane-containing RiPP AmcA n=1 Tax=Micromonospora haikouensis TaxID=686309 RepID=UPI000AA6CB94|nr:multiple cyclophane-containing RiPP AmcA [Micromonospora haikouensis]
MTVYVSRFASGQQERPGPPASTEPMPARTADPPLLTHVWRRFFAQRTRRELPR